ncbi:protein NRT1/ PTR FAMILY 5.1-like [Lotus japonicus]|uniref:protein NRT1/ PTR FAMILY 5.1-like n=1 Tax=Lotus japonicus TaxID=34305 RepID=UPI002589917C|nr:protein NRT1/ PTR FAMILY 5.1-like [Lotus japonicus]
MEGKGYTLDGTVDLAGRPVLSSLTGKQKACTYILVYRVLERFAYYGVGANLVNFMTTQLNKDVVSSITSFNNWSGLATLTPILGAYIADTYTGRFWTITFSLLIYAIGLVLLVLTTTLKSLRPACENGICREASNLQVALFYTSLYTIAVGSGAVKPNMSTFGADQFDDFRHEEKEQKVSFFNWWAFNGACGSLMATLFVVYIQEKNGWGLAYSLSAIGFLLSSIIFFWGSPVYRHKSRQARSPSMNFIRVPLVAFRNRKLQLPCNPSELHEFQLNYYISSGARKIHHTSHFSFLDRAAIRESNTDLSNPPCTVTQVEGTKLVLGMFQIWLLMLIPTNCWALESTIFVRQGTTMDRTLGPKFRLPAASLWCFIVLTTLICLPIYDHYFIPFMRRRTGNHRGIKLLQRVGIGMAIQVIAMAVTYAVETQRMSVIKKHHIVGPEETVPMSIFWLLPQNIILGVSNAFLATGMLEFFYDQSPEEMKGLGTTLCTSCVAAGSYINTFLVTMIDKLNWIGNNLNDSHLDYYYAFLFVISALNFGVFLWVSSGYIYKKENTSTTEVHDIEMSAEKTVKY